VSSTFVTHFIQSSIYYAQSNQNNFFGFFWFSYSLIILLGLIYVVLPQELSGLSAVSGLNAVPGL